MPRPLAVAVLIVACTLAAAQTAAPKPAPKARPAVADTGAVKLPVKRVILYKNGVGYFEHAAKVRGSQDLSIDFTTGQLNDVIKSLTVLDLGEGRISSVRYNSAAPINERLKGLRLPFGQQITRAEFLAALRGARVEVRSGAASAVGKLLSVEQKTRRSDKGETTEITEVSLVTDGGELRTFDVGPGTAVRVVERDLNEEVGRYLNLVGSARDADLRRMTISATGTGEREVFVSYISEVPVWKSTYRIILPTKPGGAALLQGWAIVDNTVGEDWKDVQLSLVAGAPQSFIQDISQPLYVRRPVVALPQAYTLTPQTHESSMQAPPPSAGSVLRGGIGSGSGAGIGAGGTTFLEGTVKDPVGAVVPGARVTVRNEDTGASQSTTADANGHYRFSNIPSGNSSLRVSSPGFRDFLLSNLYLGVSRNNQIDATLQVGTVSEAIEVTAEAPVLNTTSASISGTMGRLVSEAESREIGNLFSYDIKQKITIGKNQSALVPILQGRIEVEKVSIWSAPGDSDDDSPKVPLRALWLTNSSGLTLDSGTFNIIEADTFAGEGLLDSLRPTEKRLISYAADPAVRVKAEEESSARPYTHVKIVKGTMLLTKEEREIRKYTIRNSDTAARQVIIEHPAREEWKLAEGAKPEETSASYHRFRVPVEPGKTAELMVEEFRPTETAFILTNLTSDQVTLISQEAKITPAMQSAFQRILEQKGEIGRLDMEINRRQQEETAISNDQARLRENMKALKGSAEERALLQRYTRQLDAQEDRLAALRKELGDLRDQRVKALGALQRLVMDLSMDEKL